MIGTILLLFDGLGAAQQLEQAASSTTEEYYTADFFSYNIPRWKAIFEGNDCTNRAFNFLEVGSLEGRATVWMLKNVLLHPDSRITCVDTWEGSPEHSDELKNGLFERFLHNVDPYRKKVSIYRGTSSRMLKQPAIVQQKFDFIYVDAAHQARNVIEDAVLCWPLLHIGGVLLFDDYLGGDSFTQSIAYPKTAIDAFLRMYAGTYVVVEAGYQLGIQKIAE